MKTNERLALIKSLVNEQEADGDKIWLIAQLEGAEARNQTAESDQARVREYLAFSHADGKCNIYADDGELQCGNIGRHGRAIDFRREPIGDLLDIIIQTRVREYAVFRADQEQPA